jgi:hypothetical protein
VLFAVRDDMVADEMYALSTVTPVISCVIAVETIFTNNVFAEIFSKYALLA